MDTGRYHQSDWDTSSAVEDYGLRYDPNDRLTEQPDYDAGYDGAAYYQYASSDHDYAYAQHEANGNHSAHGHPENPEKERSSRRDLEREREWYHRSRRDRSRSRSRSRSSSRSRNRDKSPVRSRGRGNERTWNDERLDEYENTRHEIRKSSAATKLAAMIPSATIVVKGLAQKTCEDDLYQAFALWGPLKHVRVIKERMSGISRGFAFVDFPSVEAAQTMMTEAWSEGIVLDGRKLCFEYSKPAGDKQPGRPTTGVEDWMCTLCGCANFARRVLCFQCNEKRADDAPLADVPIPRRHFESGPTHVLLVRGLDDNVDEEILHTEFSKHATIKDLRLVRDRQTQVSRGYAFVSFHSIQESTRVLNATNGYTLDKNSQILRVSFARSSLPQASGIGASAIEAAAFARQYGWAPKEYNSQGEPSDVDTSVPGFVWDEASGYYYDSASGCYYDATRGLYYDGNAGSSGTWYSYNQDTQEYVPCVAATDESTKEVCAADDVGEDNQQRTDSDTPEEKKPTLAESVAAAALAAQAALKKAKEREKEANKGLGKKKISDALNVWKQRQSETRVPAGRGSSNNNAGNKSSSIAKQVDYRSLGRGGGNPFGGDYQPGRQVNSPVVLAKTTSEKDKGMRRDAEITTAAGNQKSDESGLRNKGAIEMKVSESRAAIGVSRVAGTRTRRRFTETPRNNV